MNLDSNRPQRPTLATTIVIFTVLALGGLWEAKSIVEDKQLAAQLMAKQEQQKVVQEDIQVGGASSNPGIAAIFETSLAAPIAAADTSMTLASVSIQSSATLANGKICFTLDQGTNTQEFVCGNLSGTTVSGMTRGVSPLTGTTTSASFAFSHRRGADVKITDWPTLGIVNNQLNGAETIPNLLAYTPLTDCYPGHSTSVICTGTYLETYANNVIAGGAPTSTNTIGGKVLLATQLQMASSTDLGISAPLVLQAKYATSSPGLAGLWSVVTQNNGKISQLFLDLTQAFTWSGVHTFTAGLISTASSTLNATTSIAASNVNGRALIINNVNYAFPSSQGASASVLQDDGSGNLTWTTTPRNNQFSYSSSTSHCGAAGCTLTQTIFSFPAGTFTASSTITFQGSYACANGGTGNTQCLFDIEDGSGNVFASHSGLWGTSQSGFGQFNGIIMANNSTSAQRGTVEGFTYGTVGGVTFLNVHSAVSQTVNMANATSIVVRFTVGASANASGDLNDFSIVVRP